MPIYGMKRTRTFLALVLGSVFSGPLIQPVHAEPLLDQSFLGGMGSTSGESAIAQTFTVGIAGTLSHVELRIFGTAPVTIDIRPTTSSGLPILSHDAADQLGRVTVFPAAPFNFSFTSVDFSAFGIEVEPGDRLAIVLQSSGIQNWGVAVDEDATYIRGEAYLEEDGEWRTFLQAFGSFSTADYQFMTFVEPLPSTLPVTVDVKPGEGQNSVNPKSNGVIPVAILTTADFDAADVDPATVKLGPQGAMEAHGKGHLEDVDGDGDLDLVLHFRIQATGIVCGQLSASLTGETLDGQAIEGVDSIRTVGCR